MTNKNEPGTVNVKVITESVQSVEKLTQMYKRKRLTTESYIKLVHESLSKMTSQRNYWEYLKNIGH
jgi:hypothetical protein